MQLPWLMDNGARLGGVVLVFAGLYQLSPLEAFMPLQMPHAVLVYP